MTDPDHLKGSHQVPDIQNIEILGTAIEGEGKADTRKREDTEKEVGEIGEEDEVVDEVGGEEEDTGGRPGASIEEVVGAGEEAALTTGEVDTVKKIIIMLFYERVFDRLKTRERIN